MDGMGIKAVTGRFGHLTVLSFAGINRHGSSLWNCRCDCGAVKPVNRIHLVTGAATYCGKNNACPVIRLERFLEKVRFAENGCWIWTACSSHFGYGQFSLCGGRCIRAHIASYKIFIGPVPPGAFVLHSCDNPACVCPTHLFLGSQSDNMADKTSKERQARGGTHGMARLNEQLVLEIRTKFSAGITKAALAREYGISRNHAGRIVSGECWGHIISG